jgi:hypothetical protein
MAGFEVTTEGITAHLGGSGSQNSATRGRQEPNNGFCHQWHTLEMEVFGFSSKFREISMSKLRRVFDRAE